MKLTKITSALCAAALTVSCFSVMTVGAATGDPAVTIDYSSYNKNNGMPFDEYDPYVTFETSKLDGFNVTEENPVRISFYFNESTVKTLTDEELTAGKSYDVDCNQKIQFGYTTNYSTWNSLSDEINIYGDNVYGFNLTPADFAKVTADDVTGIGLTSNDYDGLAVNYIYIYGDKGVEADSYNQWVKAADGTYYYATNTESSTSPNATNSIPYSDCLNNIALSDANTLRVTSHVEGTGTFKYNVSLPTTSSASVTQTGIEVNQNSQNVTNVVIPSGTSLLTGGNVSFTLTSATQGAKLVIDSVELLAEKTYTEKKFDSTSVNRVFKQTTTSADKDGNYTKRFIMLVSDEDAQKASKVNYTLENGSSSVTITSTKCYDYVYGGTNKYISGEGYSLVAVEVKGSQSDLSKLTCTITLE